jgi:hypothetical protein
MRINERIFGYFQTRMLINVIFGIWNCIDQLLTKTELVQLAVHILHLQLDCHFFSFFYNKHVLSLVICCLYFSSHSRTSSKL